jgi:hypothetical protein
VTDSPGPRARAAGLRGALVEYVRAVHAAYVDVAAHRETDPALLPLAQGPFTVAIAAADQLHLVATRDPLPATRPHEQPVDDEIAPLHWQVRFLDVTVVPELAVVSAEDPGHGVLEVLGIGASLYHLVVNPAASLDGHQAMHAGTGLANAHLAALS